MTGPGRRRAAVQRPDETAPPVSWAVALGVGPLPFLAVYAVLFIAHGLVYPVQPADIGTTPGEEAVAGFVCVALFLIGVLAIYWFLDGRRRWLFVLSQLATLITSVCFLLDPATGSPGVPFLLVVTSALALGLSMLPASWRHVGRSTPRVVLRVAGALLGTRAPAPEPGPEAAPKSRRRPGRRRGRTKSVEHVDPGSTGGASGAGPSGIADTRELGPDELLALGADAEPHTRESGRG